MNNTEKLTEDAFGVAVADLSGALARLHDAVIQTVGRFTFEDRQMVWRLALTAKDIAEMVSIRQ